jgi:hypothetical protein
MSDMKGIKRVQRLREARRKRGDHEINVSLCREIGTVIDQVVETARFPSRQVATTHALNAAFVRKDLIPQRKLNVWEAAAFLALSKKTLEKYWSIGCGPAYLKLGSKVVYDIGDLETWVSSRRRTSTSQMPSSFSRARGMA